jgi:hypothetical protein
MISDLLRLACYSLIELHQSMRGTGENGQQSVAATLVQQIPRNEISLLRV